MNILAVDDEHSALNILMRAIKEALPDSELRGFSRASEAINTINAIGFSPDVAFIDIEMPEIDGLNLACNLKKNNPNINIIFVTGFSQYVMEALALRPSGYVMKPATKEKILDELQNLRNPPMCTAEQKPIRIQCFGSFEIFKDGKPVQFIRAKSKELLAYLVDRRGASCCASETASVLWDDGVYDRSRQKQLSVIRLDMLKSLKQAGAECIIVKSHDSLSVDINTFDCDYYMSLDGDTAAINTFLGEYMSPYSWSEFTMGKLVSKFNRQY